MVSPLLLLFVFPFPFNLPPFPFPLPPFPSLFLLVSRSSSLFPFSPLPSPLFSILPLFYQCTVTCRLATVRKSVMIASAFDIIASSIMAVLWHLVNPFGFVGQVDYK